MTVNHSTGNAGILAMRSKVPDAPLSESRPPPGFDPR